MWNKSKTYVCLSLVHTLQNLRLLFPHLLLQKKNAENDSSFTTRNYCVLPIIRNNIIQYHEHHHKLKLLPSKRDCLYRRPLPVSRDTQ